jgi:uncharacterized protein YndB with AHSA1/START domain
MTLDLQLDERFPQPIDAVWRALSNRPTLARWLMENDFEPRVGHRFTLRDPATPTWRGWVECQVLELEPPCRMVWSWNSGIAGEVTSRVVFELHPEGSGTRLVFSHVGDAPQAVVASMRAGWTRKMSHLRRTLGPDFARRVVFNATRERVFDAITTLDGLRGWWTPGVSGSTLAGGTVRFEFAGRDEHIAMRVDIATRPSLLRWHCMVHTSLDEWAGTEVTFELGERSPGICELSFRHGGLVPALDCYRDCELGWDQFLASLVAYVERGIGMPFQPARVRRALQP